MGEPMKTAEEAAREFSESVWDDVPADMTFSDYAFIKGAKWSQEQGQIDPMTKHANENALIIPLNKAMQEIDSLKSQLQQSQAEVARLKGHIERLEASKLSPQQVAQNLAKGLSK